MKKKNEGLSEVCETHGDTYARVFVRNLGAKFSNKHVRYDALLVGVKRGKARIKNAVYICQLCENKMNSRCDGDDAPQPQVCDSCKRRALKLEVKESELQDIVELEVQELAQNQKHRRVEVKRPHTITVDADHAPEELAGAISVWGVLTPFNMNKKNETKNTFLFYTIAERIEASRDAFADYVPTPEDTENFRLHFVTSSFDILKEKTNASIAPYIRGRALAKLGNDLALHSNLDAECNVANAGDSRTGKTDILRDSIENLTPPGSDYVACESASRTGIAYSIDYNSSEPELRFGVLAACDTAAVGLDAVNALEPEEQAQLREALSQKRIKVNRVLQGEALARVRVIAGLNLPKDKKIGSYATRAQAVMESFYSVIDRNRYDFIFPYGENDVPQDEIDAAEKAKAINKDGTRAIPAELYKKHLAFCWQPHPIKWEDSVFDELLAEVRTIRGRVGPVPLLSNEFTKIAGKWCVAIAQRCHSFDGNTTVVKSEHVKVFAAFVHGWLSDLEIEKERQLWSKSAEVDVPRLAEEMAASPSKRGIILLLARGPRANKDICTALRQSKSFISQEAAKLMESDVLAKAKEGYVLTQLGLKVADALLSQENGLNGGN